MPTEKMMSEFYNPSSAPTANVGTEERNPSIMSDKVSTNELNTSQIVEGTGEPLVIVPTSTYNKEDSPINTESSNTELKSTTTDAITGITNTPTEQKVSVPPVVDTRTVAPVNTVSSATNNKEPIAIVFTSGSKTVPSEERIPDVLESSGSQEIEDTGIARYSSSTTPIATNYRTATRNAADQKAPNGAVNKANQPDVNEYNGYYDYFYNHSPQPIKSTTPTPSVEDKETDASSQNKSANDSNDKSSLEMPTSQTKGSENMNSATLQSQSDPKVNDQSGISNDLAAKENSEGSQQMLPDLKNLAQASNEVILQNKAVTGTIAELQTTASNYVPSTEKPFTTVSIKSTIGIIEDTNRIANNVLTDLPDKIVSKRSYAPEFNDAPPTPPLFAAQNSVENTPILSSPSPKLSDVNEENPEVPAALTQKLTTPSTVPQTQANTNSEINSTDNLNYGALVQNPTKVVPKIEGDLSYFPTSEPPLTIASSTVSVTGKMNDQEDGEAGQSDIKDLPQSMLGMVNDTTLPTKAIPVSAQDVNPHTGDAVDRPTITTSSTPSSMPTSISETAHASDDKSISTIEPISQVLKAEALDIAHIQNQANPTEPPVDETFADSKEENATYVPTLASTNTKSLLSNLITSSSSKEMNPSTTVDGSGIVDQEQQNGPENMSPTIKRASPTLKRLVSSTSGILQESSKTDRSTIPEGASTDTADLSDLIMQLATTSDVEQSKVVRATTDTPGDRREAIPSTPHDIEASSDMSLESGSGSSMTSGSGSGSGQGTQILKRFFRLNPKYESSESETKRSQIPSSENHKKNGWTFTDEVGRRYFIPKSDQQYDVFADAFTRSLLIGEGLASDDDSENEGEKMDGVGGFYNEDGLKRENRAKSQIEFAPDSIAKDDQDMREYVKVHSATDDRNTSDDDIDWDEELEPKQKFLTKDISVRNELPRRPKDTDKTKPFSAFLMNSYYPKKT